MNDDAELLRRYAQDRSEEAFAELVRRHLNLVYAAALRLVNGDAHRAQDVAQQVFTDLARKAAALSRHTSLTGWLYTSTRYAAAKAVRTEQRRQKHEQEAQSMQDLLEPSALEAGWERLRPVLDDVMGELDARDREAVLLRVFESRPFADVGAALRLTEDAARMRVERALERMRLRLARRGFTSTSAALAAILANRAVAAAPAGLPAAVTGAALSGAAAGAGALALLTAMNIPKLCLIIAGAAALAGVTGVVLQHEANTRLSAESAGLPAQQPGSSATARNDPGNTLVYPAPSNAANIPNQEAAGLKSDEAEAHYKAGNALAEAGRDPEAVREYQQALRLKPDYPEADVAMGNSLARLGRVPEAIAHFRNAIQLRPDYAEAHNNLGVALLQLGRRLEAAAQFQEALRINPDYEEVRNNLTRVKPIEP